MTLAAIRAVTLSRNQTNVGGAELNGLLDGKRRRVLASIEPAARNHATRLDDLNLEAVCIRVVDSDALHRAGIPQDHRLGKHLFQMKYRLLCPSAPYDFGRTSVMFSERSDSRQFARRTDRRPKARRGTPFAATRDNHSNQLQACSTPGRRPGVAREDVTRRAAIRHEVAHGSPRQRGGSLTTWRPFRCPGRERRKQPGAVVDQPTCPSRGNHS